MTKEIWPSSTADQAGVGALTNVRSQMRQYMPIRQQAAENRAIAPALQLTRYLSFAISDT